MLTTPEACLQFAWKHHAGQVDKVGAPYALHVTRVGASLWRFGDDFVMAGFLHDVVEDTDVTLADLAFAGLPDRVLSAVAAITKRGSEASVGAYEASLRQAMGNPIGLWVKAADVADNASRILDVPFGPVRIRLVKKYEMAVSVLRERIPGYAIDGPLVPPKVPHLTLV
jgi:(p)ppGpp synthase/HD superfamily hydrolase